MPAPPPALTVARLVDDDAVDPGAKLGLSAELREGPEDPHENILGQIERLVAVPQQVKRQLVDHPLVLGDEFGAGGLIALGTPSHQGRFAPFQCVPGTGLGGLDQEFFGHGCCSDYSKTARARPDSVLVLSIGHRRPGKVPSGPGAMPVCGRAAVRIWSHETDGVCRRARPPCRRCRGGRLQGGIERPRVSAADCRRRVVSGGRPDQPRRRGLQRRDRPPPRLDAGVSQTGRNLPA